MPLAISLEGFAVTMARQPQPGGQTALVILFHCPRTGDKVLITYDILQANAFVRDLQRAIGGQQSELPPAPGLVGESDPED